MKNDENQKIWYGVKCIFRLPITAEAPDHNVYEERITIWLASSFEEAIEKAEKEALEYAGDGKYLEYANAFEMKSAPEMDGAEVYSLMRESRLDADAYITRFYDDGSEKTGNDC